MNLCLWFICFDRRKLCHLATCNESDQGKAGRSSKLEMAYFLTVVLVMLEATVKKLNVHYVRTTSSCRLKHICQYSKCLHKQDGVFGTAPK